MHHNYILEQDNKYIRRCLELAQNGNGFVAPNPMVGAVLVYNDVIIGEGYHEIYGGPHAEVNCLNSVKPDDRDKINQSTLYVNLEPCNHFGKTPPCTELILKNNIKKVVIGTTDLHQLVSGKGIKRLEENGVETHVGVLEKECRQLNEVFFNFHLNKRPFITLKWAESNDGFIGKPNENIRISNDLTQRHAHQLRAYNMAILVGKNTVITDNPSLNTRYFPGKNPIVCIIDSNLEIPSSQKLFGEAKRIFIYNLQKTETIENVSYVGLNNKRDLVTQVCEHLYREQITNLLVEGGSITLQHFIDNNLWDKAIIYKSFKNISNGIFSPIIKGHRVETFNLDDNKVETLCSI